ncbi:hypothetical protein ACFVH4_01790 [Nocardia ignorata]|uniref:hypothetical protein n=1 Tax=Nocardia ignorata TaxID=145285 RepID=UPI00363F9EC9
MEAHEQQLAATISYRLAGTAFRTGAAVYRASDHPTRHFFGCHNEQVLPLLQIASDHPLDGFPHVTVGHHGDHSFGCRGHTLEPEWTPGQNAFSEWHELASPDVLILEGVSAARAAVRARLSLSIWVETPRDTRLRRGLDRDGAEALPLWQRWMTAEDAHFAADRTPDHADVIVDGWHPQE